MSSKSDQRNNPYNFSTPRAVQLADMILDAIRAGVNTAERIGELAGMPKGTYGRYLAHLKRQGLIHIAARQKVAPGRGSYVARYEMGEAPCNDVVPLEQDGDDGVSRFTVKDWPDGTAKRDPFDVLLFGQPKKFSEAKRQQRLAS